MGVNDKIEEICKPLILSDQILEKVRDLMGAEIDKGLSAELNPTSEIKCFPTYVRHLPDGTEQGKFLALDLGGTNFRVHLVELSDSQSEPKVTSKFCLVPKYIMVTSGENLFDHVALKLCEFMEENGLQNERLPLGFTFSFPLRQEGLNKAVLTKWTKSFTCSGVEGKDVVELLQKAIKKRGDIDVDVLAVLNDTTGTLMSCAYQNPDCRIAVIIGTGTNACYMEKLDKVELWKGEDDEMRHVVINSEWGAFGETGCLDFILTDFDREVDSSFSLNRGRRQFEKMISGMYLGEVVGVVLRHLSRKGLLFNGTPSCEKLFPQGSFQSEYITEIESDKDDDFKNCKRILSKLGVSSATEEECKTVRFICELVSTRAAALIGAGVACLLERVEEKKVTVGMEGSVYKCHPKFSKNVEIFARKLIDDGIEFELILSENGSGHGAAILAAVVAKLG